MSDLFYSPEQIALGLEASGAPRSVTQATGLGGLAPSAADQAAFQERILRQVDVGLQGLRAPAADAGFSAYFNPTTNQMFAGGRAFDPRDVGSALQASQALAPSAPPAGGGWQPLTQRDYANYVAGFSERRGTGELLARGGRAAVGGLVGGVGRGIEMLGAPQTGGAIAGFGEAITGQDEFDQQRSALIQRNNSLFSNIIDAAIEGVPSVLTGGLAALAGGAVGGPAGAAVGLTLARARTVGAVGGLVASSFPQQLNTFYEAARDAKTPDGQPAYDVTNPQTQLEILSGAVGTTLLDIIAPGRVAGGLSRALTDGVQQATEQSVGRFARARSVGGAAARSGLEEAATEALQTVTEQALFDPQFRSLLTANDWKALAPYIVEQYGENALIAAGAGALLGAGFGGAGRFIETRPRDVLQTAGEQPQQEGLAPPQVEPPAQGEMFPGASFGAPPIYDGSLATLPPPRLGQTEMFPGVELGALGIAPPPVSAQGNLFDQRPAVGTPQTFIQPELPFGAAPPVQPSQREMFPDQGFGQAPAIPAEQSAMGTPADGGQRDLFGFALSPQFVPPPPVVAQRPPVRTAENLIPPSPSVPTGMEGLLRGGAQPATAPLAETGAGNALLALRRRMELQQAEAQRATQPPVQLPTAAEQDFDRAEAQRQEQQAQAAMATPIRVEPDSVATSKDRGLNNARRNLVERFNGMTVEQQNDLLVFYDNDPLVFQDAVARMDITAVRQALTNPEAALARVRAAKPGDRLKRPRPAEAAAPAPAPITQAEPTPAPKPAPKAANLKKGTARAAEAKPVAESRVEQRTAADEGRTAPKAGRGDSTLRRGAQPQAKAQEAVTAPEAAPPRPLEQPAPARAVAPSAPSVARPAPARADYDNLIERAAANNELAELRSDLEARVERESSAGRSTTELTQAIERINVLLASKAPGVIPPNAPQSRWAEVVGDDGEGYTKLSTQARREWDKLVASNAILTPGRARQLEREFPDRGTLGKVEVIERMGKALEAGTASDERLNKISADLAALAEDPNPLVAEAAKKALGWKLDEEGTGQFSLADWNTRSSTWKNADGTNARPVPPGRARMLVQTFLSKLAIKPKVTVVANQEELRRTNPALFARANAARPQGDFATANAAGYSFGDGNVIIFTDRIANEQHLRFVLAHETFGHFGMRGIMPGDKYDALMERIYDGDPQAQAAVDAAMEVRGLSKAEAVEEYLSDYAATLATNTVARVWNSIKNILTRLGVRFGDSATRYFLDQSKRYVREGRQGVTFDAQAVAQRLHAVETGVAGTGRYSPEAAFSQSTRAQLFRDDMGAWPTNWDETIKFIFDKTRNFADTFDDIKAKFFSLANYRALENPSLYEFNKLMGLTNQISMATKDRLNEYLRPLMDAPAAVQTKISQVMYEGRSYAIANFDTKLLRGDKLFSVDNDGNFVPNTKEIEKLFKAGLLTKEQINKGFSYTHSYEGLNGKTETINRKFEGKNFTDEDYELYVRGRRAIMDVEMELLQAEYASLVANRSVSYRELGQLMKSAKLDNADKSFISAYVKKYGELYTKDASINSVGIQVLDPKAMANAEKFLAAVNAAFIGERADRNAAINDFFDSQPAADAFIEKMMDMKSRRKDLPEDLKFNLQSQVKQFYLNTYNLGIRERIARRGVATGYIPVLREGNYQMRLQAFVGNTPVEIKDSHKALLAFSQFDGKDSALAMENRFNEELKGKTFELLARNAQGEFVPTKVTLRAKSGRTLDAIAADPQLNLQDFLYGMSLFGIDANPQVMEKLVTTLTRQENAARNRLEFSGTPGFDNTTGIYAMSRHIEARASTIAKTTTRQSLRELMNLALPSTRALWEGNEANVTRLRGEVARLTGEAKKDAQRQLDRAEYMLRKTKPEGDAEQAMKYYNQAAGTLSYLDGSKFVDESNFGSGPVASRVRAYTSMMQLGGSIAQGALNLISPYTNWMPYMASYNSKNSFGGGFGLGKVQSEYHRAFAKIGAPGITNMAMNRADFYDSGTKPTDPTLAKSWKPGVAQDPALQKKHGLTADEAKVIAREIREGKLIPAQSNAMVATARGHMTNRWMRRFMDGWMTPFNLSEQAARRAAFLSAYRLFRERAIGAGMSEAKASERAREEAVSSIDLTLGEYSVLNRPPAWRNGIQSFLYMYKTYPTTTIQMLARLPRAAQITTLAGLWLLAGATGLPFAEDLEDLIDTVAQGLGFQQGSIRAEIIRSIEGTFPGMSAMFLRGVVNQIVPADVASRTSAGNFLPGTGIALAGANVTREIQDILGPAAGFVTGLAGTARDLVTFPFSPTRTLEDVARNSPVTLIRIMGDTSAYLSSGAIVDRRGYVVSPEMDAGTVITRLLGFYPERAATQYDVIRIAQREADYQKEVVAAYRQAWIKATMRGDTQGARDIVDAVNNWNDTARGTPLEINRFIQNSQRALREAQRGAGERALRAAPRAAQQDIQNLMDALIE